MLSGIGDLLSNPGRLGEALGPFIETAGEQQQILIRAREVAASWPDLSAPQFRSAVAMLCRRITVHRERVEIEISARGLCASLQGMPTEAAAAVEPDHPLLLLSMCVRRQGF